MQTHRGKGVARRANQSHQAVEQLKLLRRNGQLVEQGGNDAGIRGNESNLGTSMARAPVARETRAECASAASHHRQ